jgi:hypothetical protein
MSASASLSQNTRAHRTSRRQSMFSLLFPILTFLFSFSLTLLFPPNPLFYSPYPLLPPISPFSINFVHIFLPIFFHSFSFPMFSFFLCRYFMSPGIDSKKLILPTYVAWRAGTATLFLLGS